MLAQNLARHFGNIDRLIAATQEEIAEAEGFGPDRAEPIVEWFADDQNRALVQELRDLGLASRSARRSSREGPLTGSTYVITGTLESMTPRGGAGRARGEGREGDGLGLEEDDRPRGRRRAGRSKLTKARRKAWRCWTRPRS